MIYIAKKGEHVKEIRTAKDREKEQAAQDRIKAWRAKVDNYRTKSYFVSLPSIIADDIEYYAHLHGMTVSEWFIQYYWEKIEPEKFNKINRDPNIIRLDVSPKSNLYIEIPYAIYQGTKTYCKNHKIYLRYLLEDAWEELDYPAAQ